jgi:hypothetical protein
LPGPRPATREFFRALPEIRASGTKLANTHWRWPFSQPQLLIDKTG